MSVSDDTRVDTGNRLGSGALMEQIVEGTNMRKAYKRVMGNGGRAGVDGMSLDELKPYLSTHWEELKGKLLRSEYYPMAVLSVKIPKPDGGERELGIPTVLDRLIQQAISQVLSPHYEATFSDGSYGFRLGRNAQGAVLQSQAYIREGKRWVVDIDLSKFFDEVHHNRLLSKLRRDIKDLRVIHLIDRYLRSGMMREGVESKRLKGTPQGSPLSPLLSNIVLDELDKELDKRGLSFVRYADDFQIYVRTERSATRVKESISNFIDRKLKLKVHEGKSAIGRPWSRDFLGYSFTTEMEIKLKPSKKSLKRLKQKIKKQLRKGKGRNLSKFIGEELNPLLRGWIHYFIQSNTHGFAKELDSWIRRHLRKIKWRQWKRRWTRKEGLMNRGLSEEKAIRSAFNQRGPWWNAGAAHMNLAFPKSYFTQLGLISLHDVLISKCR
ncbi:MAG: group II intron reverse transcriptase/maturase [Bacteroidota bacterium]